MKDGSEGTGAFHDVQRGGREREEGRDAAFFFPTFPAPPIPWTHTPIVPPSQVLVLADGSSGSAYASIVDAHHGTELERTKLKKFDKVLPVHK